MGQRIEHVCIQYTLHKVSECIGDFGDSAITFIQIRLRATLCQSCHSIRRSRNCKASMNSRECSESNKSSMLYVAPLIKIVSFCRMWSVSWCLRQFFEMNLTRLSEFSSLLSNGKVLRHITTGNGRMADTDLWFVTESRIVTLHYFAIG